MRVHRGVFRGPPHRRHHAQQEPAVRNDGQDAGVQEAAEEEQGSVMRLDVTTEVFVNKKCNLIVETL